MELVLLTPEESAAFERWKKRQIKKGAWQQIKPTDELAGRRTAKETRGSTTALPQQ
jgi:hypothetical protein